MEGKDGQTERATAKKRGKEREKGNVCMSQEVNSMVVLLLAMLALRFAVPYMWRNLLDLLTEVSRFNLHKEWTSETVRSVFFPSLGYMGRLMGPLVVPIMIGAVIANMAQTKPFFSMKALKFKLSSLNPVKGLKKLFSLKSVVKLGLSILKIGIVVWVIYLVVADKILVLGNLVGVSCYDSTMWTFLLMFRIAITVVVVFVLVAILDWCHKKYEYEKNIMMTKQEIKDERKNQEGNPKVKSTQMRKMRELSLMRMMAAVPNANVVVTNPTHVAVALQYDPETMDAPKVVAKGLRLVAQRIKKVAMEHNIPIIEQPVTARSLYKHVKVGRQIPAQLYEAVAELLAYLYRIGRGIGPLA